MRPVAHLVCWSVGLASAETQTTSRERAALARYASGRASIVEIGVWHGVTTAVLRGAMAAHGVLWAVDPFPPGRLGFSAQRPIARRSVARVTNGTVVWIRETGRTAGERYRAEQKAPADLVFLDGDHTYAGVMEDWTAWNTLVAPGGMVCIHDSARTEWLLDCGSIQAVNDIVAGDRQFERVDVVDSLTVLRRRA
jgi:predicted O-methyltransferase YrrM